MLLQPWIPLLFATMGAGARSEGFGGPHSAPLNGEWAALGNAATLGIGEPSWAAFVDMGSDELRRYVVVQGNTHARGPAALVVEEGAGAESWELAFVLPDLPGLAYGFDLTYFGGEIDRFSYDLNAAAAFDQGLAVGATVRDVAQNGPGGRSIGAGAVYRNAAGGLILIEADAIEGWSAELIRAGLAVAEGGFEYRGGVAWHESGHDWTLGIGTTPRYSWILDYAWTHPARGPSRHRFGVGLRFR